MGVADLEVDLAALLAVDAVAGVDAVHVDVDRDVGAGLPVGLRAPVGLVVARASTTSPAAAGSLVTVMFFSNDAWSVTGTSKVHDDRHADADRLAGQRGHGRVGLLVERQVLGAELRGLRDLLAVLAGRHGAHGVRRARLEAVGGGPRGAVGGELAGHLAGARRRPSTLSMVPFVAATSTVRSTGTPVAPRARGGLQADRGGRRPRTRRRTRAGRGRAGRRGGVAVAGGEHRAEQQQRGDGDRGAGARDPEQGRDGERAWDIDLPPGEKRGAGRGAGRLQGNPAAPAPQFTAAWRTDRSRPLSRPVGLHDQWACSPR